MSKIAECVECSRRITIRAKGLCGACYSRGWRSTNPVAHAAHMAKKSAAYIPSGCRVIHAEDMRRAAQCRDRQAYERCIMPLDARLRMRKLLQIGIG